MRVPVSWLRSYCAPGLSAEEIADVLTMAGIKLERLHRVGVGDPAQFVVGRVLKAEPHPDADRLTVCEVDDGSAAPRTIVCGAPNVAGGQTVAVALPGAVMPDGSKLGEAKLRGVKSSGMILAEDEVGIGEDHTGIMVLENGAEPGSPLADQLPIADEVLELEITPNRPDAMAVYGVAREVHAVTAAPLGDDPGAEDAEPAGDDSAEDHASVEIADPEICLRFSARVYEDVEIGPSPAWLKQRLMAAGQRPISNVVDITNYVMLTVGQPLHAFDLDRVRGSRIVVRRAEPREKMRTLDGVEREFDPDTALVCDAEGPSEIGGIMGGEISEVSDATTRVLMVELCGARLVPGTIDAYPRAAESRKVSLRLARMEQLLGTSIDTDEVVGILGRLGFQPVLSGETVDTTAPPWRDSDVQREADLVEEVARVHGLDKIPTTLPARRNAVGRLAGSQPLRRRLEDALRDRGLHEIVSYSFTAPEALERLRTDGEQLRVRNPLSEEQSVLRPLLLPGLLDAARHNAAHGRAGLALFESAHVYLPAGSLDEAPSGPPAGARPAAEGHHLGALVTEAAPGGWRSNPVAGDFYATRALLEAVLGIAGVDWRLEPGGPPFLHPGRAATVKAGEAELGWLGELHPLVLREWELHAPVSAFEIDAEALAALTLGSVATYHDVTSVPSVLQDIAVVVPDEVSAAEVERAVRAGGGELLSDVQVFDLYRGEQVGQGSKSLALRLEFRAPDRTLTDDEVTERRAAIERELDQIGGSLRA